jgi:tetratricopeptide (TPR) repeat protein
LRGDIARVNNDLVTSVECGKNAVAICDAMGDLRTASEVLTALGASQQELGLLEDAVTSFERAADAKTRTSLVGSRSFAYANLAFTRCLLGQSEEARAVIDRAVKESGPTGTRARAISEVYSSYIAHRTGDFASAKRAAQAAMDSSPDWLAAHSQATALMARALLSLGKRKRALAHARRAVALIDGSAQIEDGEALVRVTLVECLLAAKDLGAARAALLRAKKCVDDRAALIRNAEWRHAFRTRLPENAQIESLARKHLATT